MAIFAEKKHNTQESLYCYTVRVHVYPAPPQEFIQVGR